MSDLAPPRIYYIAYPPEDAISCDICNNNKEVREDARRQRGVFKAASRRQNYVLHLGRQHDVPAENVKIRCSVCGRVSDKPSRTAWRDMQTHHRRQHAARVQPVEAVGNVALVPNKAESSLHGQEKKKVDAFHRPNINNVDEQEANIFSAAVNKKYSPIKTVGTGTITATIKEPKNLLPNKSMIMGGMGKMFDVAVDNGKKTDKFENLIHSTPHGSRSTKASSVQKTGVEISRIVPKARPAVKRSLSSQFGIVSPRKKFNPA